MKSKILTLLISLLTLCAWAEEPAPKREFRGAWLHVIGQSQYMNKTPDQARAYIIDQLDKLAEAGCNAVIFQVRPTADAMYKSDLEPWSAWLAGKRGKSANPEWDPLGFIVDEAHKRGMELHAWLNPYRVTSNPKEVLPADHPYNKERYRFFRYDNKIFFDPAYKENRDFITEVVKDIVKRYDVDAIHMDDYFYPYPNGPFNADAQSYAKFGGGQNKGDWRRHNVDMLIEQLYGAIKAEKPWVRFGISPFGIWRNKKHDPRGSDSNGLENYDSLYADILLWAEKGWVDYVAPQLYWELDLKVAPSRKLAQWWSENIPDPVQLYIGQDTKRTMDKPTATDSNELATKIDITRRNKNIDGNVWWHGYWVTGNYKGVLDKLASRHQSTLAIAPEWAGQSEAPKPVKGLRTEQRDGVKVVAWDHPDNFAGYREGNPSGAVLKPSADGKATLTGVTAEQALNGRENDVVKYAVYEFFPGESIDISDPAAIIAITPYNAVRVDNAASGTVFIVTAIDRLNRESPASGKLIVK